MLTKQQKDQYYRDGNLLIPNVLTAEQVKWLRSFFRAKFDLPSEQRHAYDTDHWLLDIFSRHQEVRWLCFHEPTVKIVQSLLGKDFLLHGLEATVHLNWFGGWHKDTGSPEREGHTFFLEKDYESLTVAFYLQENSAEYGGGLDVEPGSHREPDQFIQPPHPGKRSLIQRIWHQVDRSARQRYWLAHERHHAFKSYVPSNVVAIPSKPGDLLIFDFRLNHHATPPRNPTNDGFMARGILPPEHEKIAIFFGCSRNTPPAHAYLNYIRGRKDYPFLKNFAYPADLLEEARKAGVNLLGQDIFARPSGSAYAKPHVAEKELQAAR